MSDHLQLLSSLSANERRNIESLSLMAKGEMQGAQNTRGALIAEAIAQHVVRKHAASRFSKPTPRELFLAHFAAIEQKQTTIEALLS